MEGALAFHHAHTLARLLWLPTLPCPHCSAQARPATHLPRAAWVQSSHQRVQLLCLLQQTPAASMRCTGRARPVVSRGTCLRKPPLRGLMCKHMHNACAHVLQTHTRTRTHTYKHTRTHKNTRTHAHTHAHTHTHTHTRACGFLWHILKAVRRGGRVRLRSWLAPPAKMHSTLPQSTPSHACTWAQVDP